MVFDTDVTPVTRNARNNEKKSSRENGKHVLVFMFVFFAIFSSSVCSFQLLSYGCNSYIYILFPCGHTYTDI